MHPRSSSAAPASNPAPPAAGGELVRRRELLRLAWFVTALAVAAVSSAWFCLLQPPHPDVDDARELGRLGWWWHPQEQNPSKRVPTLPDLNAVFFVDADRGWAVGPEGVILHTADGGQTWAFRNPGRPRTAEPASPAAPLSEKNQQKQDASKTAAPPAPAAIDFQAVFFVNAKEGWAGGTRGEIYHTVDAGLTWTAQPTPSDDAIGALFFIRGTDANPQTEGWAAGANGLLLHTVDGGQNWVHQSAGGRSRLRGFSFATTDNGVRGWVVGNGGLIFATAAGEAAWEPQSSPTTQDLHAVHFIDAQRGWVVGSRGLVRRTRNGGRNWEPVTLPAPSKVGMELVAVHFADPDHGWILSDGRGVFRTENGGDRWTLEPKNTSDIMTGLQFSDARRGWAVGSNGCLLQTTDGGRHWRPRSAGLQPLPRDFHFVDARRGWLVWNTEATTRNILHTADGGQTWDVQETPIAGEWRAVHFVSATTGWVGGTDGKILQTEDGGRNWIEQSSETKELLFQLHFADARSGWAAGSDTFRQTRDGGETWSAISRYDYPLDPFFLDARLGWARFPEGLVRRTTDGGRTWQVVGTERFLHRQQFLNAMQGWALADTGRILRTDNGGETWRTQFESPKSYSDLRFSDFNNGWAVAGDLTSLRTQDGGETWAVQPGTPASPGRKVQILDENHAWAIGRGTTLLATADGGATWSDPRRYRRGPAPLYYVCLGLAALLLFRAARSQKPFVIENSDSVGAHGVSDNPLSRGDTDELDFSTIVGGLGNYLRNPSTGAPLTIAINGAWGSGKTSIMNLLRGELEQNQFRPVWFNAWHHQQEEHLLAALLQNIRSQAVPRIFSPAGLEFRCRLFYLRLRTRWPVLLFSLFALALIAAVASRHGLPELPDSAGNILEKFKALATGPGFEKLAALVAGLIAIAKLVSAGKAFGLDPARLLASASGSASVRDLGAQTSFRYRFACEFRDVALALHPRRMVIFIDDLDRCDPAQVVETLQAVNFLASSGPCFQILGIEEKAVRNAIAAKMAGQLELESGEKLPPAAAARRRWDFAGRWLEKMVQVRITVPSATDEQFRRLLAGRPHPGTLSRSLLSRGVHRASASLQPFLPFIAAAAVIVVGLLVGELISRRWFPKAAADTASLVAPVVLPPPVKPGPEPGRDDRAPGGPAPAARPTTIAPAQSAAPQWWLPATALVVLAAVGAWRLLDRLQFEVRDSRDFGQALERWSEYVRRSHRTPRSVKRYVNKVRFYAMLVRDPHEPGARPRLPEGAMVAFGALEDDPQACALLLDASRRESLDATGIPAALHDEVQQLFQLMRDPRHALDFAWITEGLRTQTAEKK